MKEKNNKYLSLFGFNFGKGGAHLARTMMFNELRALIHAVGTFDSDKSVYQKAIVEDNCLGKRSLKTRQLSFRHLVNLYGLDPSILLFRALLFIWNRDPGGQPLLALLCAYSRDPILRKSIPFILDHPIGSAVTREKLESYIDDKEPGRFSGATLKSTAQNINSTLTQSGHFSGRVRKVRLQTIVTAGSVSYALLLGFLRGIRGESLFSTEYFKLLDCSFDKGVELAEEASRKGWIVFKRVGRVIEVLFPSLLTEQEMEWVREQN